MSVLIRLAGEKEAALIADLSRKTFYDTFAAFNTKENMNKFMDEQFTREKLMEEVTGEGNIFLLAFEGEDVIGYARLRDNNNPKALEGKQTLEIARIYAMRELIGKGVGKVLMGKSISIARERQKEMVWLGVWEKNTRAIRFYLKWGFKKFGEHDFILGNDVQKDWLMKKNI